MNGVTGSIRPWAGTLIANTTILACGLGTGVLTARLLLPEGRGALAAVLFWPQLIATLGLLSVNEATAFRVGEQPDQSDRVAAAAVRLVVPAAVIVAIISYLTLPWLLGEERRELWSIARLYALILIPLNFLSLSLLSVLQGRLQFSRYNLLRVLVPVTYLIGLLALWVVDEVDVLTVAVANLVAAAVVCGTTMWYCRSVFTVPVSADLVRRVLRDGLAFHGATILMVLASQADRLVALRLYGDATVGYYMVAFALASVGLSAVSGAFHTVLFPQIAQSKHRIRPTLLSRGVRSAVTLLVPLTVVVALWAPQLVVFAFGSAFAPAGRTARALVGAFLLMALKEVLVRSIRGAGEARAGVIAEGISLMLFLVLAWPLGGRWGPIGLALALAVGNAVALIYLTLYLRRVHGLRARSLWAFRPDLFREIGSLARAQFTGA